MPNVRFRKLAATFAILVLAGIAVALIWVIRGVVGVETRTTSPTHEQVAYCREYLYITPDIEIEPLAYYVKDGMDYMVRFKFIAQTDDPALVFDSTQIDSSEFSADFDFPPGEETHNEIWWDIAGRPLTGASTFVPSSGSDRFFWIMHIGIAENGDGTLTVYAWRCEHGQYRS